MQAARPLPVNCMCTPLPTTQHTHARQHRHRTQVPMVIRGPGGVGRQLGAEHSQRLESYFQAVPGLKIVACSTPYNAKGRLKSAIRDDNPVLFFEHVLLYNLKEDLPNHEY